MMGKYSKSALFALSAVCLGSLGISGGAVPASASAHLRSPWPAPAAAGLAATDWSAYQHGVSHTSAIFGDTAITPDNADSLTAAWQFLAEPKTFPNQPARKFDASPTVVNDKVYIGSRTGWFYALDGQTGEVLWKKQLGWGLTLECPSKGIVSTATVTNDPVSGDLTVYAAGAHYLYALDAATGAELWKASIGPDTDRAKAMYFNWSSPAVAGGHVFMGLGANCDDSKVRGGVVSIDQHTGVRESTWHDSPPGTKGATVWSSQAYAGSSVWATTGSPDEEGTAIYDAYSIVRLTADTLEKRDQWKAPNPLDADLDFGSSPTLFNATLNAVTTPVVAGCNKNGIFYVWRRRDLASGPVWQRRVGQVGGEETGACITTAAWDSQLRQLFVASNITTIGGAERAGGLRALNPDTGAVIWQQPLPCLPTGSPTINGQLVAVPLYTCPAGVSPSVMLFRESDGELVATLPAGGKVFAQPVFAAGKLFVASGDGRLTAYAP
jgi:outer membrane protein assembly factor BamB